jgi:acyl-CoA thioester hydrolase
VRVRYSEVDAQGHVNNAVYLSYFEVGRVEWLRAAGLSYRDLEREGFGFVVVEALVRYRRAAFFDDELTVRTQLTALTRALLRFEYAALRGEELLATGYTRHACVRLPGGHPTRVPTWILDGLAPGDPGGAGG